MSKVSPITVFLIDDEFPKTMEFVAAGVYNSGISADNLYHLAITEDWKSQFPLQQLIKDLVASESLKDGMIKLIGFTQPSQALSFLGQGQYPSIIIYDWEYGMPNPTESQNLLLELFEKTKAFVFVYSIVRNKIPEFLNKSDFDKFAKRFQLFLKGSSDNYIFSSEEFILQYILSRVSSNFLIKLQGIDIRFSENGYLESPTDILYLEKILGRNLVLEKLKELGFAISQESIEKLFENVNGKLLFDSTNKLLITEDSIILKDKFHPDVELSYSEVLKKYGLLKLRELIEIGYLKV
jgi:hypothetical protein